eukprot:2518614-Amphidinium_carterae.1
MTTALGAGSTGCFCYSVWQYPAYQGDRDVHLLSLPVWIPMMSRWRPEPDLTMLITINAY